MFHFLHIQVYVESRYLGLSTMGDVIKGFQPCDVLEGFQPFRHPPGMLTFHYFAAALLTFDSPFLSRPQPVCSLFFFLTVKDGYLDPSTGLLDTQVLKRTLEL